MSRLIPIAPQYRLLQRSLAGLAAAITLAGPLALNADTPLSVSPVRWSDPMESLSGWRAGENTLIELVSGQFERVEGGSAMKIVCQHEPGMTESGWSGWYRVSRSLPKVKVQLGDVLSMGYRFDRYEPYYPGLYVILGDTDGTQYQYNYGSRDDAGHWIEAQIPIDSGQVLTEGDKPGLQTLNRLTLAYSYKWFRGWGDYVRWVDDIKIGPLSESSAEEAATSPAAPAPQEGDPNIAPAVLRVKTVEPQWPVVFVPYIADLGETASLAAWKEYAEQGQWLSGEPVGSSHLINDPEDMAAKMQMAWNDAGLHILTEVHDDRVDINSLTQQDFADCDSLRMQFDNTRDAFATGESYDEDDYTFAFIADSPLGTPMAAYVHWYGYEHPINDEERVFDVGTITIDGDVRDDGYSMAIMLPTDLMRGYAATPNHAFTFSSIWADVDGSGRESETMYPTGVMAMDYWKNMQHNADAVLLGDTGGFTFRITEQFVSRGHSWKGALAAVCPQVSAPLDFKVTWTIRNDRGDTVSTFEDLVKVGQKPAWVAFELPTQSLDGGHYTVVPSMSYGNVSWEGAPWPVELEGRAPTEWLEDIAASQEELRVRDRELRADIDRLAAMGREVAYLKGYSAVAQIFDSTTRYHIKQGNLATAEKQLAEVLDLLDEADARVKELDAQPRDWTKIPAVHRPGGETVWEEGAIWKEDRPVAIYGPMGSQVATFHTDDIASLGFNGVSYNIKFRQVMLDLTEPRMEEGLTEIYEAVSENIDKAGLHMIHILPEFHMMTAEMKKDPRLGDVKGHFLPFDITLPIGLEMADQYYSNAFPFIEETVPQTLSYCLLNEPTFELTLPDKGKAMFEAWLQDKYGSIDQVNKYWGTDYAGFDEVPITRNAKSLGARYDWIRFNQTVLSGFIRDLIDVAHAEDPAQLPVHIKVMAHAFSGYPSSIYEGIDHQAIAEAADIVGYDGSVHPIFLDFYRSLAPDKVLLNSEGKFNWMSAGDTSRDFWTAAVLGVDAQVIWLWDPPWGSWGRMENYMLQQPAGLHAGGKATLDIQRLMPQVYAISRTEPQVRLLFSIASRVNDYDGYNEATNAAYEMASRAGVTLGFWTEEQLQERNWDQTRLLILSGCSAIEPDTAKALADFVEDGGTIMLVGEAPTVDVYGQPLPENLQQYLDQAMHYALSEDEESVSLKIGDMLDMMSQAGINAPLRFTDAQGRDSDAAFARWVESDEGSFVFVAAPQDEVDPVTVNATWKGQPLQGLNLINHEPVDGELLIKPGNEYLIEVGASARQDG